MDVGGNRSRGEGCVEGLRAELDADFRGPREIDRPLESSRLESLGFKQGDRLVDGFDRYDEIDIPGDHGLLGPMVDGNAADRAPRDVGAFQTGDKTHHVVRAATRLPVVKSFVCHRNATILHSPGRKSQRYTLARARTRLGQPSGCATKRGRATPSGLRDSPCDDLEFRVPDYGARCRRQCQCVHARQLSFTFGFEGAV